MPFVKNDTRINRGGRPLGAKNKISVSLKDCITDFLNENFENILTEINELRPDLKVKFYFELLEYVLPKAKNINQDESETQSIVKAKIWFEKNEND